MGRRAARVLLLLSIPAAAFQNARPTGPQLVRDGKLDAALEAFRAEAAASPRSVAAHNGVGVVLDLLGRYQEAHQSFNQAIKAARSDEEKAIARRAMAISYAFAADCKGAEKYESEAFDFYRSSGDFYNAGEVATELGRICLESGDFDRASEWYRRAYDTAVDEPNMSNSRWDLWRFRLAHAQARIAARRGKQEEARKRMAAAKAILEKRTIPEQEEYFPYLAGYVAFYAGDHKAALAAFEQASVADPFIQCMIARTFEALGNREQALSLYRRAASTTAHSVPAAIARPFATRKLQ